ncbi:MAG: hypothetical protein WCA49_22470 [Candidatus Sulfotelmatobacter sp.]
MASNGVESSTSPVRRHAMLYAALACGVLVTVALAMLNGCGGTSQTVEGPPPSGPSVVVGAAIDCSTTDFYSNSTTVCYSANVAGCPNASNLNFTYSYDNPGSPKGTIVFLSGGSGTDDSGDNNFAEFYFGQGYEVVQIEWAYDWELTTIPAQYTGNNSSTTYTANIQLAACREATFLNFIFNTNNPALYSGGGRCAQGSSAGSAGIAYALTFYGAGNYLDAVELKSGPPLADIEQGCEEPNTIQTTICGQNNGEQDGCQLGGTSPWTLSPMYTGAASGVRTWTDDNSCAVPGTTTSAASNLAWLQQSIVNDGTNNPTYSYPKTAMTAWLCQTLVDGSKCVGGQGGSPQNDCPNNAASQGEIYYAKLTSGNNLPQSSYNIYAVQNCDGPEGVSGTDPTVAALGNESGTVAIEKDMIAQCVKH